MQQFNHEGQKSVNQTTSFQEIIDLSGGNCTFPYSYVANGNVIMDKYLIPFTNGQPYYQNITKLLYECT